MEGDSVNLNCSSNISYVNSYTWFKRSGTQDIEVGFGQNYTIMNINITDNKYKCRVSGWYETAFSEYKTIDVFYSPKNVQVSVSPSARVMEGSSVTLTCSGDANPPVHSYTWIKRSGTQDKDIEVGYGKSYTITNIAITDNNYKCRASNQHGSAFSEYQTLDILYRPKNVQVSVRPSARVMEGSSVTLTCSGDANPPVHSYTWFKRSGTQDIEVGYEKSYTISYTIAITDNNYKCRASNQHGSAFSEYQTLNILYSPKNVSVSPSARVMEGSSVTLTCSGDANPPVHSYTWFKRSGSQDIEVGYEKSYTITNINITDNNYKCRASNQHGSAFSEYQTLDILYRPKNVQVSVRPSARVMEGSSVTLTCSGDANPPVHSYTWFKRSGTQDIEVGYEKSYTISYTIAITDNNYRCRASNQHGSAFSEYQTLNILYSPKNVSVSPSARVMEGSSVTLTCSGDANPPVHSYTWFKRSGSQDIEVGYEKSYTITNINITDNNYKCRASNQHGSAFSEYQTLDILYRPKNVQVSVSPSARVMEGSSVTLTCSGDANPPVHSYTWFKRSGTQDIEVGYANSYTIKNIAITDNNYKCRASNKHGSAFSEYQTLNILYSPTEASTSVILTCRADGNPPVEYIWYREGEITPVAYGQTYRITSFSKDNIAQFYCTAGNGIGPRNAVSVPVTFTEECHKAQVAAAGIGGYCGGLITAALFYVLWMRWKKQNGNDSEVRKSRRKFGKNTAIEEDYENVDPEFKDDTYNTLNPRTGSTNDVYETLATTGSATCAMTEV
ncbi:B-cell receptor CD22 isoform X4 [Astyanax mexicanus]|uniref:B-cell receptor CD22 isoform X4 n=1 Tax=Astyanax mexicanus TaxID=7994 RepID=UPI0020CB4888|nr:B-cell receptor CD22 isoform X4 [Astyanax mexicanus]